MASPPVFVGEVYAHTLDRGTHLGGDVDSFHFLDDDVISWQGESYVVGYYTPYWWLPWIKVYIYAWHLTVDAFTDTPSASYSNVRLEMELNFVGASHLTMTIYYEEGGNDVIYMDPTGGYSTKCYTLDDYKHVWAVVFEYSDLATRPYLYIDFLCIGYDNS